MNERLKCKGIWGAITGDIIGSVYETNPVKSIYFKLLNENSDYTDDTVLTVAVADALLHKNPFDTTIQSFAREYPNRGYGGYFKKWVNMEKPEPYGSYGNGSAMRVSAVAYASNNLEEVIKLAKKSAEVTHNHPEGIKGAQAVAASIFMAETGALKWEIKEFVENRFSYNLDFRIEDIRKDYKFTSSCQETVPQAIVAFLESDNFEQAVRLSVSLGGDSDTLACMSGAISAAFYKRIPKELLKFSIKKLDRKLKNILDDFSDNFCTNGI